MKFKLRKLSAIILTVLIFTSISYTSGVVAEQPTTSEILLFEGWNLIGLPFAPENPSIEVVLADIIADVYSVWAYDAVTGLWSSYSPGAPSDLTMMVDDKGYWINLNTDRILTIYSDGYILRNPSMLDVYDFIEDDRTDENEYIIGEYTCRNFAIDLKFNSFKIGYLCYYTIVNFPESSHAIVSFNTTDRGLVYIEPQNDDIMEPQIGNVYWDRTKYSEISYNDTIIDILLIP